jgi:Uncharacterized conserved protein
MTMITNSSSVPIKHHFPQSWQQKIQQYYKIGGRKKVVLKTGSTLYIRTAGVDDKQAVQILDKFTLQGAIPEPVRGSSRVDLQACKLGTGRRFTTS